MNKSTMIAAIFAASAFSAFAADVYSSNIVGYTKLAANGGVSGEAYTMLAAPFTPVGGGEIAIKDLFLDNSIFQAGDTEGAADTIKIWTGAGYTTYFYSSDVPDAWASDQDSFTETEDTIPVGTGFWLYRRGAAIPAMLTAGEVIQTNVTVTVNGNDAEAYTQVANPFAAALPIASIAAPDWVAGDTEGAADTIKVWTGAGYATYFYSSDVPDAWASDQDSFTETTDSVPVGASFWIYRRGGATTATLPVPY